MGFGTKNRLPAWIYGAIAAGSVAILLVAWSHVAPLSRAALVIEAVFWSSVSVITSLQPRSLRS